MTYSIAQNQIRPIRFLELWQEHGWRIKLYGISQHAQKPEKRYVSIAKEIAGNLLPQPAVTPERYGAAFITIHQADLFNQIVFDWWERDNELRHHVFKAEPTAPESFENITATGEAFCVWELRVIAFEREAWLNTMLKADDNPDIERYLQARLNIDV